MAWITGNRYLTDTEQKNNADIIINYYRAQGINDCTIAGILGNIQAESTFSPELEEVGGSGYGLVQWTPISDLKNACSILGLSPYTSGDVQLQVILNEIKGTPSSINQWYTSSAFISKYYSSGATSDMVGITSTQFLNNEMGWTADKLAIMFMAGYERPSYDSSVNHYSSRMSNALKWFEYMQGIDPGTDYIARIAPFIKFPFYVTSVWWEEPRNHRGLDISTGGNDNLYSMCNGTVVLKSYDADGYGNYLIMKDSTTGMGFLYGHLKDPTPLNVGDTVQIGQFVGIEGTTGHSTGNHLHIEMQDISSHDWIFGADKEYYTNPAEFMGFPNQEGISVYYYGVPFNPHIKKKKNNLKWLKARTRKIKIWT